MSRRISERRYTALDKDLVERMRLRRVMGEHCTDVLVLELGVAARTVRKIEVSDSPFLYPRLDRKTLAEVSRRRRIYNLTKEQYESRYSDRALMARYDISRSSLHKRAAALRARKIEQWEKAA